MLRKLTVIFGILGVVVFVTTVIIGGYLFPGYSHLEQLISESYATGTAYEWPLRWYGFIPSGFMLMLFGFLAPLNFPKSSVLKMGFYGIAIFYGIATIITGLFPCDFGCNEDFVNPSLSQLIHNLSGTLTYFVVPICLLLVSLKLKTFISKSSISKILLALSLLAIVCTVILIVNHQMTYIGLIQRCIEGSILLWIVMLCLNLKNISNESI